MLEELKSAREIIDILQKELYKTVPSKSMCESSVGSGQEAAPKQANSTEWTTVPAKYTSAKANRRNLSVSPTINQQIVTWNKYTPLHNLRDSDAVLNLQSQCKQRSQATLTSNKMTIHHGKGRKIPTIENGIQQPEDDQKPGGMKVIEWTHFSAL
jgi:hypothetical protein